LLIPSFLLFDENDIQPAPGVGEIHGELPVRARSSGELAERVRRAEDYAALGARVVVELNGEAMPPSPALAFGQSPDAATAPPAATSVASSAASTVSPTAPAAPTRQLEERGMVADGSSLLRYARNTPSARAWSAVLAGKNG
jgi:hypothetical protein